MDATKRKRAGAHRHAGSEGLHEQQLHHKRPRRYVAGSAPATQAFAPAVDSDHQWEALQQQLRVDGNTPMSDEHLPELDGEPVRAIVRFRVTTDALPLRLGPSETAPTFSFARVLGDARSASQIHAALTDRLGPHTPYILSYSLPPSSPSIVLADAADAGAYAATVAHFRPEFLDLTVTLASPADASATVETSRWPGQQRLHAPANLSPSHTPASRNASLAHSASPASSLSGDKSFERVAPPTELAATNASTAVSTPVPDAAPDAAPDATPGAAPDATSDAAPDATSDAAPKVGEASAEAVRPDVREADRPSDPAPVPSPETTKSLKQRLDEAQKAVKATLRLQEPDYDVLHRFLEVVDNFVQSQGNSNLPRSPVRLLKRVKLLVGAQDQKTSTPTEATPLGPSSQNDVEDHSTVLAVPPRDTQHQSQPAMGTLASEPRAPESSAPALKDSDASAALSAAETPALTSNTVAQQAASPSQPATQTPDGAEWKRVFAKEEKRLKTERALMLDGAEQALKGIGATISSKNEKHQTQVQVEVEGRQSASAFLAQNPESNQLVEYVRLLREAVRAEDDWRAHSRRRAKFTPLVARAQGALSALEAGLPEELSTQQGDERHQEDQQEVRQDLQKNQERTVEEEHDEDQGENQGEGQGQGQGKGQGQGQGEDQGEEMPSRQDEPGSQLGHGQVQPSGDEVSGDEVQAQEGEDEGDEDLVALAHAQEGLESEEDEDHPSPSAPRISHDHAGTRSPGPGSERSSRSSRSESGSGSVSGSGSSSYSGSGSDSGSGSESPRGSRSGSYSESNSESGSRPRSRTGSPSTKSRSGSASPNKTRSRSGSQSGSDTGSSRSGSPSRLQSRSRSGSGVSRDSNSKSGSEPGSDSGSGSESDSGSNSDTGPASGPESDHGSGSESESDAPSQSGTGTARSTSRSPSTSRSGSPKRPANQLVLRSPSLSIGERAEAPASDMETGQDGTVVIHPPSVEPDKQEPHEQQLAPPSSSLASSLPASQPDPPSTQTVSPERAKLGPRLSQPERPRPRLSGHTRLSEMNTDAFRRRRAVVPGNRTVSQSGAPPGSQPGASGPEKPDSALSHADSHADSDSDSDSDSEDSDSDSGSDDSDSSSNSGSNTTTAANRGRGPVPAQVTRSSSRLRSANEGVTIPASRLAGGAAASKTKGQHGRRKSSFLKALQG